MTFKQIKNTYGLSSEKPKLYKSLDLKDEVSISTEELLKCASCTLYVNIEGQSTVADQGKCELHKKKGTCKVYACNEFSC